MNMLRGAACGLLLVLAGCAASPPDVRSTVSAFHRISAAETAGKRIAVMPAAPDGLQSLEFQEYREKIKLRFVQRGAAVTDDPAAADWLALVGTTVAGSPVQVQEIWVDDFPGRPFGPWGYPPYGGTMVRQVGGGFVRTLTLEIYDRAALDSHRPDARLYEGKAVSQGTCAVMAGVFDAMADALFADWPGPNGRVRTLKVPQNNPC